MSEKALLARDLCHILHPCVQMKDFEQMPPLLIRQAKGAYLTCEDGRLVIDAISSWWCKSLGHGHPSLKQALVDQLSDFEHVIFSNTTFEKAILLSERLAKLSVGLDKVAYASDGSCAVEMALKMSLHARQIEGKPHKTKFMALENAYHGETGLALGVSDIGIYKRPYESVLLPCEFLRNLPYVFSQEDPLWANCEAYWPACEAQLLAHAAHLTALIVEPVVQGAGGMLIYSADFLRRLRAFTQAHDIHLIADEIMTGFYRSGLLLGLDHAGITPDFLCLGKALTGGVLPLSAMLTRSEIYELFYDDHSAGKSFLHSHTHSGNALAISVALAALEVLEEEKIAERLPWLALELQEQMRAVQAATGALKNLRHIGAVVAADLVNPDKIPRLGHRVFKEALKLGAFLRPLGDTIYWCVPLNTEAKTIQELSLITVAAIRQALSS